MVQFQLTNSAKNVTVDLEISFGHETLKRFVSEKQNLCEKEYINFLLDMVE